MRRALLASAVGLVVAGAGADRPDALTQRVTATTVLAVRRWVDAVRTHTPGQLDDAVAMIVAFTGDDRRQLQKGLEVFLHALSGKGITTDSTETTAIARLGADVERKPGVNAFLYRAAVLHADAVMADPIKSALASGPAEGPGGLVLANDGEYVKSAWPNWNWSFARNLLDLVQPGPAGDPLVATWYHATSAYMMRFEFFGEAAPNLERAMQIFSDDARIVFDRACLAETLGLPRARQVLDDPRSKAVLGQPQTASVGLLNRPAATVVTAPAKFVTRAQTEAEAERLFRRAFSLDPSLAEARVRLGRLYESHGRHADALTEVTAGLAGSKDDVTSFYGHLVAARAAKALGRTETAIEHARAALKLFPNAQSALVATSQLALADDDPAGAIVPIRRLAELDPDTRGDPWWHYESGLGRHADALLAELWAAVRKEGQQ